MLRFQLLQKLLTTLQAKNIVRTGPACSTLFKSHNEAITCVQKIITYAIVEKGMEAKENKGKLHDANTEAAAIGKKERLETKRR